MGGDSPSQPFVDQDLLRAFRSLALSLIHFASLLASLCHHLDIEFYGIGPNKRTLSSVTTIMSEYLPPSHQNDWSEPTKFDKLRIKTEMQLVQLIKIELDLGIQDARQALKCADTWPVREACSRRANRAYAKATRLLPLVVEISEDERSRVESRLEHLQRMLEALSAIGSTLTPTEDEIATLARAVWEARGCPEGLPEENWLRAERALKAQRESNSACFVS
jgi:hypothetical protein